MRKLKKVSMILVEKATESSSDPWHPAPIQPALASQGFAARHNGVRSSLNPASEATIADVL
jgi:lambda repressor-like predicted transcriptional regulator